MSYLFSYRDIASLSLGEAPRVGPSRLGGDNWSSDTDLLNAGLPRRNHTHLGHGSNARRTEKKPEDLAARAHGRVAKRLADVRCPFTPCVINMPLIDGLTDIRCS